MTAPEIRPATDDQVRAWHDLAATGLMIVPTTIVDSLVARIEADRAERESNNRAFADMCSGPCCLSRIHGARAMTAPETRQATDEPDESASSSYSMLYSRWETAIAENESLRARIRQLEAEGMERHAFEIRYEQAIEAEEELRAAARERDRKIAELEQERDDDTALIRRLNATVAARAEEIERLKAACRDIIHAHDLAFAHGQPLVFANGKHFDHTHFNGAAESARAALKPESPVR